MKTGIKIQKLLPQITAVNSDANVSSNHALIPNLDKMLFLLRSQCPNPQFLNSKPCEIGERHITI